MNIAKLYLYENTAKNKLDVICFHTSDAISSLNLIGPEDTQSDDLKITQPHKLGHLTPFFLNNDCRSRDKARGNRIK